MHCRIIIQIEEPHFRPNWFLFLSKGVLLLLLIVKLLYTFDFYSTLVVILVATPVPTTRVWSVWHVSLLRTSLEY